MLWKQTFINQSLQSSSVILPLEATTVTTQENFLIKLDSNVFPESSIFTSNLFNYGEDVPIYSTGNGFGYDFNITPGAFFFLGPSGLYDIGFDRFTVTNSNDDLVDPEQIKTTLLYFDFNNSNYQPYPVTISGTQHAQIYMKTNGALLITPNFNTSNSIDYYNISPCNALVMTRLSTNW
jgi:hypothetical protein